MALNGVCKPSIRLRPSNQTNLNGSPLPLLRSGSLQSYHVKPPRQLAGIAADQRAGGRRRWKGSSSAARRPWLHGDYDRCANRRTRSVFVMSGLRKLRVAKARHRSVASGGNRAEPIRMVRRRRKSWASMRNGAPKMMKMRTGRSLWKGTYRSGFRQLCAHSRPLQPHFKWRKPKRV